MYIENYKQYETAKTLRYIMSFSGIGNL